MDEPRQPPSVRSFLTIALPPFVLSLVVAMSCYIAAGSGLGLFLGGIALGMVLAPPLVLAYRQRIEQLIVVASIVDGVGVVWLVAMFRSDVTFAQWLAAYVLIAACVLAAMGVAVALERLIGAISASAATITVSLAWLTWPIWLSVWINSSAVVHAIDWLVPIHPLLAMNGLFQSLGIWGEWPIMCRQSCTCTTA